MSFTIYLSLTVCGVYIVTLATGFLSHSVKMASNENEGRKASDHQQQRQQHTSDRLDFSSASNMANMKSTDQRRYNSVQEYSRTLQHWLWNYHCMASASSFYSMMPLYMAGAFPPGVVSQQSSATGPTQGTRPGTQQTSNLTDPGQFRISYNFG